MLRFPRPATIPARPRPLARAALAMLAAAVASLVALPPGSGAAEALWRPPLGRPLEVTGGYRAPPTPYAAGHRGIDLAGRPGDAVVAPAAGEVSFAGRVVDRGVVSVRLRDGTVYSLEPVDANVAAGDPVAAGERLGEVAAGGHCAANCLHLGVRVDGAYVNPIRYLRLRPVLLPW